MSQPVNEFRRGGLVLFACFVGIGVNLASMAYYATGIWIRPWQAEFGWARAEIGAMQTLSVLTMMVLATFAGRLIDKYGLKIVTTASLAGYGILLLGFTLMTGALWQLSRVAGTAGDVGLLDCLMKTDFCNLGSGEIKTGH